MYCEDCEDSYGEDWSSEDSESSYTSDSDWIYNHFEDAHLKPMRRRRIALQRALTILEEDYYYSENIFARACARSIINKEVYSTDVYVVLSHPIHNRSRDDCYTALRRKIDCARILSQRVQPDRFRDAEIYSPNWKRAHRPLALAVHQILFDYPYYHLGFVDEDHETTCADVIAAFKAFHAPTPKEKHQKRHQTRGRGNKNKKPKIEVPAATLPGTLQSQVPDAPPKKSRNKKNKKTNATNQAENNPHHMDVVEDSQH
jgi:hypothetical protein